MVAKGSRGRCKSWWKQEKPRIETTMRKKWIGKAGVRRLGGYRGDETVSSVRREIKRGKGTHKCRKPERTKEGRASRRRKPA